MITKDEKELRQWDDVVQILGSGNAKRSGGFLIRIGYLKLGVDLFVPAQPRGIPSKLGQISANSIMVGS